MVRGRDGGGSDMAEMTVTVLVDVVRLEHQRYIVLADDVLPY